MSAVPEIGHRHQNVIHRLSTGSPARGLIVAAGLAVCVLIPAADAAAKQPAHTTDWTPVQPGTPEATTPDEEGPVTEAAPPESPTPGVPMGVADDLDGERRLISGIDIRYIRENRLLPSGAEVLQATVTLVRTPDGFIAPRDGLAAETLTLAQIGADPTPYLYDSALALIAPAVVRRLNSDFGLIGVYAEPDPRQFAVVEGQVVDRRPPDRSTMTIEITTGVLTQVRTIGVGERIKEGEGVDNPIHQRIKDRSPVRADDGSVEQAIDVLRGDLIDDYIYRLNRHPGRRVDVAVGAAGDQPGAVTLDYIVTENRPWFLYFQLANTGTESTDDLRERFGFIHNQLTNSDDTLSLEYMTANFDDIHSFSGSYSRPFFGSERLRWRVYGSWYTYDASEVGLPDANFEGEGSSVGGELTWNVFQHRDLFIDLVGGLRADRVEVDNQFAGIEGDEDFVLGYAGATLERNRETSSTFASAMFEYSLVGGDEPEIDRLGRLMADEDWAIVRLDAQHSFYLEPIFNSDLDESSGLAHEVALTGRVQASLGDRLVPNYQQTVGGLYTVRGYPEAIVAGDTTFIASAEYRFHLPRTFSPSPEPGELFGNPFRWRPQYAYGPVDWDLIFKGFVDYGRVLNEDRQSFEEDATLVSVGIGAEFALSRALNFRIDWGIALHEIEDALGDSEVDEGDSEVHFVLTVIF